MEAIAADEILSIAGDSELRVSLPPSVCASCAVSHAYLKYYCGELEQAPH